MLLTEAQGFPWSVLFGVAGTLAGFALNELSYILRGRREDKRKIGQALAELLEIRHQIRAMPEAMQIFRSMLPVTIPGNVEFQIRAIFRTFIPDPEALRQRYSEVVTSVAGAFPLLAFELRTKDFLTPTLNQLSSLLLGQPQLDAMAADAFVKLEDELVHATIPILEDLIRKTAKRHSRMTRRDVDAIFRRKFEIPEHLNKSLSQLLEKAAKAHAEEMAKAAQATPTPQQSQSPPPVQKNQSPP